MNATNHPDTTHRALLEAISFAARAHRGQLRKDGQTPYASHAFRVCMILRHIFEIDDQATLIAAVLHDTVEDTTTDFDDIEENFGHEIAGWVATLSKDKRRVWTEREAVYEKQLAQSPWQVQVCKLADIFDNLTDMTTMAKPKRAKSLGNAQRYLAALHSHLTPQALRSWNIVHDLCESSKKNHHSSGCESSTY